MSVYEKKMIQWINRNKNIIFFIAISILSILIRVSLFRFESGDMTGFFLQWYEEAAESGGFHALSRQIGDYSILFQTLLALYTYLPVPPVYCFKAIAVIFDFVIALSCAFFVTKWMHGKMFGMRFNCIYTLILSLPTIIFNSSAWGQCDAIYTAMALLSLFYLLEEKNGLAFIFLGCSFAFKFQAVFLLPFFITFYFYRKNFSIFYFILSICVFWLSGVPGFLAGRDFLAPFRIYLMQSHEVHDMTANYPNIWWFVGPGYDNYLILRYMGIFLTLMLCGMGAFVYLSETYHSNTKKEFLSLAGWFLWTIVMFLPGIHERYAYLLDILLLVLCFCDKKLIPLCAGSVLISTIAYVTFLFPKEINFGSQLAVLNIILYLIYSFLVYSFMIEDDKKTCSDTEICQRL